jgi:PAS domain S-box-containing protein
LEMIHSHIAKKPAPAHEINADIPEPISAIIMRLLEKNAIDRYQSVFGLRRDLERSIEQLDAEGSIQPFELGESDFTGVFLIPQKLYGREDEVRGLLETFERVSEGTAELLLVAGYSGVGKTALVHEVQKSITVKRGYFIEGKFDQYQRNIPYSAWGQALGGFVTHLLMKSESQLENWKAQILEAVGLSGNLLTDMIPNLELVIGPQPDVPELDGQATQNRLNYVFQRFIKVIARKEHPLVVFLDDLQWIDSASLNFLKTLLTDSDQAHCLIIGAYRDNEVEATHPLMVGVAELQETHVKLERLTLNSLLETDVNTLCSETLRCPSSESRPLAQLIYTKTGGNAFFTHRMLRALYEDKLLAFDSSNNRWQWDLEVLSQLELADNVIDLMVTKVSSLPEATRDMLKLAACMGNQFDLSSLSLVVQQPVEAVHAVLEVSFKEIIVSRGKGIYKFAHDRIQQAVYSLIHPDARAQLHRRIGFSLLENTSAGEISDTVFDVVGHLNQTLDIIARDEDRLLISKLNLRAGQKAKSSAAYSDAKKYIEFGLALLGSDSWQHEYELSLSLHNENGHLAALTGKFEQVDATAELIQAKVKNILDKNRIDMIRIEAETMQYNLPKALQFGLQALKDLGVDIPMQPTDANNQKVKDRLTDILSKRSNINWADLPEMTDKTALAKSALLASLMSTSYVGHPPIYAIVSYSNAILTLEHGVSPWSPFAFTGVSSVEIYLADHEISYETAKEHLLLAKQMQQVARDLMAIPLTEPSWTKTTMILSFISVYIESIDKAVELTEDTYRSGYQTGDMLYGAYGTFIFAINSFGAGMNLASYQSQLFDYVSLFKKIGQVIVPNWLSIFIQTAQNFMESSPNPEKLQGDYFDEDNWLPEALANNDICGRHIVYVHKLVLAYHFDIDHKLEDIIREVEEVMIGGRAMYSIPTFYFYAALSKLRLIGLNDADNHPKTLILVDRYLQLIQVWSEFVPSTYQHKYSLISAEKARVTGDLDGALSNYEMAIRKARFNGFIHEEALANELYGRFWAERVTPRFASPLLNEACRLYKKWGAMAKAKHLAKRSGNWIKKEPVAKTDEATVLAKRTVEKLDIHTVLKASQKIAGEIEITDLLASMMEIVIENVGAQIGFFLMEVDGQWKVVASGDFESKEALAQEPREIETSGVVSQGIIDFVMRTRESVVLNDAANEGDFTKDQTIQDRQSKSILCTPLIDQGRTICILYLENNSVMGAFTVKRMELLNMLSSQMSMALDNANLYSSLKTKVAELSESESRFRALFEQAEFGISHAPLGTNGMLDGSPPQMNQTFCDILGYTSAELEQKNFWDITHPDDRARDVELQTQFVSGVIDYYTLEKRFIRKDSSVIWVKLTLKDIRDDNNTAKWSVAVMEDISERKHAEEQVAANQKRLRAMASELIFAEERERQRIATELHDGPAQSLALALLQLEEANEAVVGSTPGTLIDAASQQVHQSLGQIRGVLLDLSSPTLHQMGLSAGLSDWLGENIRDKHGLRTVFHDECGGVGLPQDIRLLLFRNACELLTNVVKHGQAQSVSVSMACRKQTLQIVVEDDGVGFDTGSVHNHPDHSGGFGLFSIAVRMADLGGSLEIVSAPGKGCKATLTAPLEPTEEGVSQ